MPEPADLTTLALPPDAELCRLLQALPDLPVLRFRDGEYLMREGDEAQDAFFVVKGALAVERPGTGGGPPTVLATTLCNPEAIGVVGEMAWFGAGRRSASVRSAGSSLALQVAPRHQEVILAGFPDLTRRLCETLAQRLKETNQLLMELQQRFQLGALPRQASEGEILFRRGEPATSLIQLAFGTVRWDDGQTSSIQSADQLPGGFLDLGPYLRGDPHSATATVEGFAFLATIDQAHRLAVLRSHPEPVLELLRS